MPTYVCMGRGVSKREDAPILLKLSVDFLGAGSPGPPLVMWAALLLLGAAAFRVSPGVTTQASYDKMLNMQKKYENKVLCAKRVDACEPR